MIAHNEGIIVIDKPVGPTSFDVVRKIRKLSGQKRIGHAGTLDPLASGLLVVCLGRYTKLAGLLTESDKVYETTIKLGVATSTDDGEGEIIGQCDCEQFSRAMIEQTLKQFVGPIMQAPPKFSAIKINGQRAYAMARKHEEFVIDQRPVEIFSIDVLDYLHPFLTLRVHCSKGTYIRSLARDVGDALKVFAHAHSIRRTQTGSFSAHDALAFSDLSETNLLRALRAGANACVHLPMFQISVSERDELRFGRNACQSMSLASPFAIAMCDDEPVAVMKNHNGFATIARII